jgi:hypothetical protein
MVAGALAASAIACAGPARTVPGARPLEEPAWENVFEPVPPLLLAIRPRLLRADPTYGPLLRRALELARTRSRVVASTRAIDAFENADEVIFGLNDSGGLPIGEGDLVAVLLGVRADIDPGTLVDGQGRALWVPGPNGRVRELSREADEQGQPLEASLFELPGRTWVIASGEARIRARDAFVRPGARPRLPIDDGGLAVLRVQGSSLVAQVPFLRPPAALAPLGADLQSLTLTLAPGAMGYVEARLTYFNDQRAGAAEAVLRETLAALARKKPGGVAWGWLSGASVERASGGSMVAVKAALPPEMLSVFEGAGRARPAARESAPGPKALEGGAPGAAP